MSMFLLTENDSLLNLDHLAAIKWTTLGIVAQPKQGVDVLVRADHEGMEDVWYNLLRDLKEQGQLIETYAIDD